MIGRALALAVLAAGCSGEIRFSGTPTDGGVGSNEAGVRCNADVDCIVDNLHCEPVTHACVPCLGDDDCKDDNHRRCDSVSHQCVECGLTSDCGDPGVETCIAATHECVPTCSLAHEECATGSTTCDTARGICVTCRSDAECTDGQRSLCELESGRCVACRGDGDCHTAGKLRCDASGDCVRCVTGADCSTGVCEPNGHVCVTK